MSNGISANQLEELRKKRISTFKKEIEKMIATNDGALVKSRAREAMSRNRFRKDYTKEVFSDDKSDKSNKSDDERDDKNKIIVVAIIAGAALLALISLEVFILRIMKMKKDK